LKLLRLKITDAEGFRSLPCGFEHHFRTEWNWHEELDRDDGFSPFVCAGPNGSGKSNLLEALSAIFYQLELQRVRRNFLPQIFEYDPVENPHAIKDSDGSPAAYELEYLISVPATYRMPGGSVHAHVRVLKESDKSPWLSWVNCEQFELDDGQFKSSRLTDQERDYLLPQFVLGYSSGENEVLSLPFFKTRFVQFDEYWNSLRTQSQYPGRPDARLVYMDSGFSQAVLLCNLLFESDETLRPFREDVGIEALERFRIVLRRTVLLDETQARGFLAPSDGAAVASGDAALQAAQPVINRDEESGLWRLNVLRLMEEHRPDKMGHSSLALDALRRCATIEYHDDLTDTLILDYWVNDATRLAFQENFDRNARALFQAFQVLLTLNLYTVSDTLKADLYRSKSDYVSETVPTLASDERVMRFKFVSFSKQGTSRSLSLKNLSDGEHQLLHSLGLCLLFRDTNSLFLLDEPETHFNPGWRANFISRLRECLVNDGDSSQEMMITTHAPFLISDSKPERVLVFGKDKATGAVSIGPPGYNTLGASINKITAETFDKHETIGVYAESVLEEFLQDDEAKSNPRELVRKIMSAVGDSIERTLAVQPLLQASSNAKGEEAS
jgi:restriction system-associated AAA family ATPase